MVEERKRHFLSTEFDEAGVDPDILAAVLALRDNGVETIASCSGICQIGVHKDWGLIFKLFSETRL
jgi:hypothetical protein